MCKGHNTARSGMILLDQFALVSLVHLQIVSADSDADFEILSSQIPEAGFQGSWLIGQAWTEPI